MQQFFLFITEHWLLSFLFISLLAAIIWLETQGKVSGMARISPQQAINLINRQDAVIIDIRDKSLFAKGHIAQAMNFSATELEKKDLKKYQDKPVIIVCNAGATAPKMAPTLKQQGLTQLYFLQGGMAAWNGENLPLVKKK